MKNKYKLIKTGLLIGVMSITLSGCVYDVDCDIKEGHLHLYKSSSKNLVRYLDGEKETYFSYTRSDEYILLNKELEVVVNKHLFLVNDNLDYLNNIINSYNNKREAYVYDLYYGPYYGWDYGYNNKGEYGYYYDLRHGYHYDYEWQEIGLDEYTEDKVRDINYCFKFYKIMEDGSIENKLFDSLEDREEGYNYFRESDLVQKYVSDEYYLDKEKVKVID